jgi:hypothetical protein
METASTELKVVAQELSGLGQRISDLERVNARLEDAALTTARALAKMAGHWDAVYEAMRRKDSSQEASER